MERQRDKGTEEQREKGTEGQRDKEEQRVIRIELQNDTQTENIRTN
jgi:hypothetical protein